MEREVVVIEGTQLEVCLHLPLFFFFALLHNLHEDKATLETQFANSNSVKSHHEHC
jgi:hypothetical protein